MPVYHPANGVLESIVGAVVSSLIELEVTGVVLQLPNKSQALGFATVHVAVLDSVVILHDVLVCVAGHTHASV